MEIWAVSLSTSEASPPRSDCLLSTFGIRSLIDLTSFRPIQIIQCSTSKSFAPPRRDQTLALKLFRREPAITRFDQLFTAYHNSSDSIARLTSSGLPSTFIEVHPGHGKITWFRVLCMLHSCPYFQTLESPKMWAGFALLTLGFPITPPAQRDQLSNIHKLVGSFFNRHPVILKHLAVFGLRVLVSIWFQVLFHRPQRAAFHLSLTVLVHYRF